MALVVFLRGVNVGGHRTFRPSILARDLAQFDVVNIGAAGTFVVRKPGTRTRFVAALRKKLPFETHIVICDGKDILALETTHPFGGESERPEIVRFVSIMERASPLKTALPVAMPPAGQWLVRVVAAKKQFVFGMYRRHMKTIAYLGKVDGLFGVPVTTRNWNTIGQIARVLREPAGRRAR